MKKLIFLLIMLIMATSAFGYTSAFDIRWGETDTYSDFPSNTLRKCLEGMEGRLGGQIGTGNIYYVDSSATQGDGTSWDKAKITLQAAIDLCTADNGDVILVAQGHAESDYTGGAAMWNADCNGIVIWGCGEGTLAPTFTYGIADANVIASADNVTISNLRLLAGVTEVTTGIYVTGNNFTMIDCVAPEPNTSTYEFDKFIVTSAGADDPAIKGCTIYSRLATGATSAIDFADVNRPVVYGCTIVGEYSSAPVWSDNVSLGALIKGNTIQNLTSGEFAVEFTAATTGLVEDNVLIADTVLKILDAGSMFESRNTLSTTADTDGLPNWVIEGGLIDSIGAQDANIQQIEDFLALADANSKILVTFAGNQDANVQQIETHVVDVNTWLKTWTGQQDANIGQIEAFAVLNDANSKLLVTWTGIQDANIQQIETHVVDINTWQKTWTGQQDANIQQIEDFLALNDANSKTLVTAAGLHDANFTLITTWRGLQDANIGQLEAAALPSYSHPNYFTIDANMTSVTWNSVAAHEIADVTGNVRMTIMAECTHENLVSAGTNATIVLGVAGNTSAIWASANVDDWDLGEVASAVYAGAPTYPLGVGEAHSSLTHVLTDVVIVGGLDVGYTIGTSAGTLGTIKWHVWWTPLDSTGAVTAGAGGGF